MKISSRTHYPLMQCHILEEWNSLHALLPSYHWSNVNDIKKIETNFKEYKAISFWPHKELIPENFLHLFTTINMVQYKSYCESYVYWNMHHLDSWITTDQFDVTCLLFHCLLLNMFWMLVHPYSGACKLLWIYFMCCIVLVRCVLVLRCGSVSLCRLKPA